MELEDENRELKAELLAAVNKTIRQAKEIARLKLEIQSMQNGRITEQ